MVRCLSVQSPIEKSKIILTEAGARVSEFQISHILANIELNEGFRSYSIQEFINRFVDISSVNNTKYCVNHEVGLKIFQVLEAPS